MAEKEFSEAFIFIEETHEKVIEIKNYIKILTSVILQQDEFYYLQDFSELVLKKCDNLVDFMDEEMAKPVVPVLKQK